jgi:hypothetical protein
MTGEEQCSGGRSILPGERCEFLLKLGSDRLTPTILVREPKAGKLSGASGSIPTVGATRRRSVRVRPHATIAQSLTAALVGLMAAYWSARRRYEELRAERADGRRYA